MRSEAERWVALWIFNLELSSCAFLSFSARMGALEAPLLCTETGGEDLVVAGTGSGALIVIFRSGVGLVRGQRMD